MSGQPAPEAANGQPGEAPKEEEEEAGKQEGNDDSPSRETPGEAPTDPDASKTAKDPADEDEDASDSDSSSAWSIQGNDDDDDDGSGLSNYLTVEQIEAGKQKDKRRRVRKWRRACKAGDIEALILTQAEVEASDEEQDEDIDGIVEEEEEEEEEDPDAAADETTEEDLIRAGINFRGGPAAPYTLEQRMADQILARVMKGELDPKDVDQSMLTPKPPQSGGFVDTPGTGGSAFDLGGYTCRPPVKNINWDKTTIYDDLSVVAGFSRLPVYDSGIGGSPAPGDPFGSPSTPSPTDDRTAAFIRQLWGSKGKGRTRLGPSRLSHAETPGGSSLSGDEDDETEFGESDMEELVAGTPAAPLKEAETYLETLEKQDPDEADYLQRVADAAASGDRGAMMNILVHMSLLGRFMKSQRGKTENGKDGSGGKGGDKETPGGNGEGETSGGGTHAHGEVCECCVIPLEILQARADHHTNQLGSHVTELRDHKQRLGVDRERLNDAHGRLDQQSDALEAQEGRLGAVDNRLGAHQDALAAHDTRLAGVDTRLSAHGTRLDGHDSLIGDHGTTLEAVNRRLDDQGAHLQTHAGTLARRNQEFGDSLQNHETQLQAHRRRLDGYEDQLHGHDEDHRVHRGRLGNHDGQLEALTQRLDDQAQAQAQAQAAQTQQGGGDAQVWEAINRIRGDHVLGQAANRHGVESIATLNVRAAEAEQRLDESGAFLARVNADVALAEASLHLTRNGIADLVLRADGNDTRVDYQQEWIQAVHNNHGLGPRCAGPAPCATSASCSVREIEEAIYLVFHAACAMLGLMAFGAFVCHVYSSFGLAGGVGSVAGAMILLMLLVRWVAGGHYYYH
ncbi:hypothetical protein PG988_011545 [Apiospora saccharicola]